MAPGYFTLAIRAPAFKHLARENFWPSSLCSSTKIAQRDCPSAVFKISGMACKKWVKWASRFCRRWALYGTKSTTAALIFLFLMPSNKSFVSIFVYLRQPDFFIKIGMLFSPFSPRGCFCPTYETLSDNCTLKHEQLSFRKGTVQLYKHSTEFFQNAVRGLQTVAVWHVPEPHLDVSHVIPL